MVMKNEGINVNSRGDAETSSGKKKDLSNVGVATFHINSGQPHLKISRFCEWNEALQPKYHLLDTKSRFYTKVVIREKSQDPETETINRDSVAAAVIGSGAAAVGGSVITTGATAAVANCMGYTVSGIAANSMAAAIMSTEALLSGGGVVAGGFTASMQTIGTVGVMASPVGLTLAAGGAIAGLGGYLLMRHGSETKKEQRKGDFQFAAHGYCWIVVTAKQMAKNDDEYVYDHMTFEDPIEAGQAFEEVSVVTKVLFDPRGVAVRVQADPLCKDGWKEAFRLYCNFLVQQN